MKEGLALGRILPPTGYGQLPVFEGDLQRLRREAGHREGDPESAAPEILDIVGGIALSRSLRRTLDLTSGVFEAEQEGTVKKQVPVHGSPQGKATLGRTVRCWPGQPRPSCGASGAPFQYARSDRLPGLRRIA